VGFEDICYSTAREGVGMVFTSHNLHWGAMVVVVVSTSLKLGVLGTEDGVYCQANGRAKILLSSNYDECYPVGLAVDYTATLPMTLLVLLLLACYGEIRPNL
jgi:hypothetical protein